jgi:hypothetical protein
MYPDYCIYEVDRFISMKSAFVGETAKAILKAKNDGYRWVLLTRDAYEDRHYHYHHDLADLLGQILSLRIT